MAAAIASAGSGVGTIVLGMVTQAVVDQSTNEGWKTAFYMLAGVSFFLIIIPGLFLGPPPSNTPPAEKPPPPPLSEVFFAPGLPYFMTCLFIFGLGSWNPIVHNLQAATNNGWTEKEAATAISVSFGACTVFGRPLAAKILEKTGRREGFPGILIILALMAVLQPAMTGGKYKSLAWIYVNNGFYGFGFGAFISVLPPITAELVGMQRFPLALGLVYASFGISNMVGPPLCGYWASAVNGNYDGSYYASGGVMFLAAAMSVYNIFAENQLAPPKPVVELHDEEQNYHALVDKEKD